MPYKLFLELEYDMNTGVPKVRGTNIKEDKLCDILDTWIAGQMGLGRDEREAEERDVYHIRIELDLSGDIFRTTADTGNRGLTAGIVMDSRKKLAKKYPGN